MARDIRAMGKNTLQNVASKVNQLEDMNVSRIKIADIMEYPENEYLFGDLDDESVAGLASDIDGDRKNGQYSVIIKVWKVPEGGYLLRSGNRRMRAEKKNGEEYVYAQILPLPEKESERKKAVIKDNTRSRNGLLALPPVNVARVIVAMQEILEEEDVEDGTKGRGKGTMKKRLCSELNIKSESTIQSYRILINCSEKVSEAIQYRDSGWLPLHSASSMAVLAQEKQDILLDALWTLKKEREEKEESLGDKEMQKVIHMVKKDAEEDGKLLSLEDIIKAFNEKREEKEPAGERAVIATNEDVVNDEKVVPREPLCGQASFDDEESFDETVLKPLANEKENDNDSPSSRFSKEEETVKMIIEDEEEQEFSDEEEMEEEDSISIDELAPNSRENFSKLRILSGSLFEAFDNNAEYGEYHDEAVKVLSRLREKIGVVLSSLTGEQ